MLQNSWIEELKKRVEELKIESMYQLRQRDDAFAEKLKDMTEKFIQDMELLKKKNQVCMIFWNNL